MNTRPSTLCRLLIALLPLALLGGCDSNPPPQLQLEVGMHTAPIGHIATDAAGRWALTASLDKTARVWEAASGRQVQVLRPPQGSGDAGKLWGAALSPDGAVAAVGGFSGHAIDGSQATIYLFDRAEGRLLRRLPGLPGMIQDLTFSPDGHWLAATLSGPNGVRIFDAASGAETGRDTDYGESSYSARFSPDGKRLVTTSWEGKVRLYTAEGGKLAPQSVRPGSGRPYAARFSPDGRMIAVGFWDSAAVQVLDGETLGEVAHPNLAGTDAGLGGVAWSADGRSLFAGGQWSDGQGKHPVRRWSVSDWSSYQDLPLTSDCVMDLTPVPGNGVLYAARDPAWGLIDRDLRVSLRHDRPTPDTNNVWQEPNPTMPPGLEIKDWRYGHKPTLNGKTLDVESYSLVIAPDGQSFVLGTPWWLRRFDREGKPLWKTNSSPRTAVGLIWIPDAAAVVAAYEDGTLHVFRADNGKEVAAMLLLGTDPRGIVWNPEGFSGAFGPDAEELMGWHVNRGEDREGEFVSARQLRERFYQPGLGERLLRQLKDKTDDVLLAEAVRALGTAEQALTGPMGHPPRVELLSSGEVAGEQEVTVKVRVNNQEGDKGTAALVFYVDGQPRAGRQTADPADGTHSRTFALAPGDHRIEVAARNAAEVEGPRQVVKATVTGPVGDAALHILAVGVETYPADPWLRLHHSGADAQSVADALATRAKPLFKRGVSAPVVMRDAGRSAIENTIAELTGRMQPQDTLVIFLAGRGAWSIAKGYTFLPADFKRGASGEAAEGLSERRLRDLLAQCPAQTLLLLDTYEVGGTPGPVEGDYQRLGDLNRHAVIGATRPSEFAQDGHQGHGVFAAALLSALQNQLEGDAGGVRISQLAEQTKREVQRIAQELGGKNRQAVAAFLEGDDFPLVAR